MKHIKFITKLAMVVAGSFMLASFSPSLDGRAVVVDEGVMPSGLFAKTVGYLPGDVISVSNAAGNGSVDLLVIGALDASEGVAIMLTPEAAKAVGIEKDSNSIVKITKRNGQDDRVYGNAVISSDKKPASDTKVQKAPAKDNPSADSVAEEVFQEENPVQNVAAAAAGVQGSPMFDEEEEGVSQAPVEEIAEEKTVIASPVIEKAEDTSAAKARAAERQQNAPVVDEVAAVAVFEEEEPAEETPVEQRDFVAAVPFDDVEEVREVSEDEKEIASAIEPEEDDDNYDSYDAIVLVPAAANPPVNESIESYESAYEPVEKTAYTGKPASEKLDLKPSVCSYQNLVVNSEKDLIRNSYYVQIATMRDDANIQEVVNKYGNNYPITIVQLSNNSKQILIGSLSMDEYAVVLERFKSYGYKDAFLRKIR